MSNQLFVNKMRVLAQSAAAVSGAADTAENILATVTIPAGAIGANGRLQILTSITVNNDASAKTIRVRFGGIGGTIYYSQDMASLLTANRITFISNRNATNSQVSGFTATNGVGLGTGTGSLVTSAIDTTAATTLVITVQKADGTDTMTLEQYQVILFYGA